MSKNNGHDESLVDRLLREKAEKNSKPDEYNKPLDEIFESDTYTSNPDPYDLEKYLDPVAEEGREPSITDYFEPQTVPSTFEEYLKQRDPIGILPDRVEAYRAEYEKLVSGAVLTDGEFEVEGLNFDGIVEDEPLPDLSDYAVNDEARSGSSGDEYLGEVEDPALEEFLALRSDIQDDLLMYENPGAFLTAGPQTYRMRLVNTLISARPTVLSLQLDKEALTDLLLEYMASHAWKEAQEKGENISREAFWSELIAEDETKHLLNYQKCFFTRIFPRLIIQATNIAVYTALAVTAREYADTSEDREKMTRATVDNSLKTLEGFLKERMGTRRPGAPRKNYEGLAGEVWQIGVELMGDGRGKKAVPALKTIATHLEMTTTKLSKALIKLGRPWETDIKVALESLPPSVLPFGYTKRNAP